ncbi:MAG: hypothetical protein WCT05_08115 [Lentisphaeria bacterium]
MSGIPQGAMHKGFRAIIYYCREDPRVYIYKHPRWKWVGVTLNFAHPVAFVIVLLSFVSLLCFVLPGVLMQNTVWIYSGLAVWSLLLCRYYFRNAERDFQRYANTGSEIKSN